MKKLLGLALVCALFSMAPSTTWAQAEVGAEVAVGTGDGAAAEAGAAPDASATVEADAAAGASWGANAAPGPAPQPAPTTAPDGVRFRGGIAASGGGEFASGFAVGMGGLEGRAGVQINNLIGVYLQPSLSFGAGSVNGTSATVFTGTAGISALIDFTIENYFFVGVGGGVGILNNPIGPEIHVRAGGYPVMVVGGDGYSRHGLMVGVDARLFLLSSFGGFLPVTQILGSIGYEAF